MKENIIKEKSFDFALLIIKLYQQLIGEKEYVISKQLLRSGTSIGANVEEASAAISRKEFISKMSIASKEARETRYWLLLLQKSQIVKIDYSEYLNQIEQIINILTAIVKSSQQNNE
jgi:four helix bundle protein